MKKSILTVGIAFSILSFILIGCESNPIDPSLENEKDHVKSASANSAEIYNTVASVKQVGNLLDGPDNKITFSSPDIKNPNQALALAKTIKKNVLKEFSLDSKNAVRISGVLSDSLLWEITRRKQFAGYTERLRVYYDYSTGKARVEDIKFDFDDRHKLQYDSATVKVDLNFTLEDESDDVLNSLEELKQYKPGHQIQEERASVILDEYDPGTEPTGGIFDNQITYIESSFITSTIEHAELHAGSGGSWNKKVSYSDGTTSSEKVTFTEDGKGTFEETRRFGTKIVGTFDSPEEDGIGSFTKTTTFPPGSNPESIYEAGDFTYNAADSTLHGSFEKEIHFKNGTIQSESVKVDESWQNGVKTTQVEIKKSDGSGGTITIQEGDDGDRVTGEWTDADGTFTKFKIDYYTDGSAHLEFSTYASKEAYENGDPPIVSGIFNFNPDSSGEGKVTEGDQEHSVVIGSDGSQSIGS